MSGTRGADAEQVPGTATALGGADVLMLDLTLDATAREPGSGGAGLIAALAAVGLSDEAVDTGIDFVLARLLASDLKAARDSLLALLAVVADHDWPAGAVASELATKRLRLAGPVGAVAAALLLEALGRPNDAAELTAEMQDESALLGAWARARLGDWRGAAVWSTRTEAPADDQALLAEILALAEGALSGHAWREASLVLERVSPRTGIDRVRLLLAETAIRHRDAQTALAYLEKLARSAEMDGRPERAAEVRRLMAELVPGDPLVRQTFADVSRQSGGPVRPEQ